VEVVHGLIVRRGGGIFCNRGANLQDALPLVRQETSDQVSFPAKSSFSL
jgi:hypothetical protein